MFDHNGRFNAVFFLNTCFDSVVLEMAAPIVEVTYHNSYTITKESDLSRLFLEQGTPKKNTTILYKQESDVIADGVLIEAPKMHCPFDNCAPFEDDSKKAQKKKKRKKTLHQLTVDFQSEDKSELLQEFRELLLMVRVRLVALHKEKDEADGKALRKVGKFVRPPKDKDDDYPDKLMMKFEPREDIFQNVKGKWLPEEDIEFDTVDVQPTFQLHSTWRHDNTYYPRFVLIKCIIHEKL